jgi:hypothetical protein
MRTIGIEIKGSDCIPVLLEGTKQNFTIVDFPKKISLQDSYNSSEVRTFYEKLKSTFTESQVNIISIKKRMEKGKFAGGALSFKMEGLIQLATDNNVHFISSPQIKSLLKKNPLLVLPQINKYQEQAFYAAFNSLEDE